MSEFLSFLPEIGFFLFLCMASLCAWRFSEWIRGLPYPGQRARVPQPQAKQQSVAEFKQQVTELMPRTCPQCEKQFVGKKCDRCDYVPPIGLRHARVSFVNKKKELERTQ